MHYLEVALLVLGVVTLAVGYRTNRRNLLLAAGVVLFFAGVSGSSVKGFADGFVQGFTQAEST